MKLHQVQPFLSGISATDPRFSRDGEWVAYASYPDHALWRSRRDGSERIHLTYPPVDVDFPSISPDGTKVSFHTNEGELFVIGMEGGTPRKVSDNALYANWSPDGNYLSFIQQDAMLHVVDVRTGKKVDPSPYTSSASFWLDQNTLVAPSQKQMNFVTFNLKTRKMSDLGPKDVGPILNWMTSPDGKYLYFTTGGEEPKVERIQFADQRLETITTLKDFHRVINVRSTQINVAPDGSPIFTRDTGYQEIYALNIKWP
jgi:dipeptidyl aminopeptidase/acylaminoacyl peptidase